MVVSPSSDSIIYPWTFFPSCGVSLKNTTSEKNTKSMARPLSRPSKRLYCVAFSAMQHIPIVTKSLWIFIPRGSRTRSPTGRTILKASLNPSPQTATSSGERRKMTINTPTVSSKFPTTTCRSSTRKERLKFTKRLSKTPNWRSRRPTRDHKNPPVNPTGYFYYQIIYANPIWILSSCIAQNLSLPDTSAASCAFPPSELNLFWP